MESSSRGASFRASEFGDANSYALALLFELALDGVAVLLLAGRGTRGLALGLRLAVLGRLLLLAHGLADLHRRLTQVVHRGLHPLRVVALQRLAQRGDLFLDLRLDLGGDLVAVVAERLLDLVREGVRLVAGLDAIDIAAVLFGMRLRVLHHLLDLVLAEAARGRDRDVLLLAARLVLRFDVEDPVRVDVERHLDLRHAARSRRDAVKDEARQALVVPGKLALALDDVDLHLGLAVAGRREDLRLRRGDRAVALDELGGDATQRLDPERQRRDVEKKDVLHLALQHTGLDRRANSHDLIGIHGLVRLLAEQLLHGLDDQGHARHTTDEDDLIDLVRAHLGVGDGLLDGTDRLLDEVADKLLQLAPRERDDEVLRTGLVRRDERQVDLGLLGARELDLRLLRGLLQTLKRHAVVLQIDALVLLELLDEPVDDPRVEVVATQVRVTVGGFDLEDALTELQDGDVEGATAQVVDGDDLVLLLVESVGKRGRGRLVDDPQDLEAGDLARVLGRLALAVVEVRGHGDDRLRDLVAEERLCVGLQLPEDHCRHLGWGELAAVGEDDLDAAVAGLLDLVRDLLQRSLHLGVAETAPHEALDRVDRVLGVRDRLPLRDLADQTLPVLGERDDGRRDPSTLRVRDDRGLTTLHVGHGRVRGAQVDSNHFWHVRYSFFLATVTNAGLMTRSCTRYALWCSSMTASSGSSDSTWATA